MDYKALFAAIKAAMEKRKMNSTMLSRQIGISSSTLNLWFDGKGRQPEHYKVVEALFDAARIFKIDIALFADMETFGGRLEFLRMSNGLTRRKLEEMSKVSHSTIFNWERNNSLNVYSKSLEKVAVALGTTTDYLLHGDKKELKNGLVDLLQSTVQMTFEEADPVEVEVEPEIDDVPVDDVEPEVVEDEADFTIPPENEIVTNPKVMFSTEIADLTGKSHNHVMRDIREIDMQISTSPNLDWSIKATEYKAGNGQMQPCYSLDYEATMIVLTGYDVVARAKVIKRWQELEKIAKGEAPKVEPKPESSLIENIKAASAVIDVTMTMLNRLGIEGNQATLGANKVAAQATGFNILEMIGLSTIVSSVQERYYTPTVLGEDLKLSGQGFNKLLAEKGFQIKVGDKWTPTEKGKPFAVVVDTDKAHATGATQQLFWYKSIKDEIEI